MSGSKSSSSNRTGGKSESQNQSSGGTFVDPSQSPFLEFLRSQGQGLAQSQLAGGGGFGALQGGAQGLLQSLFQGQQGPTPGLENQIQQGQSSINRNLQENLLPSIGGGAAAAGQRGSSRQGVAEGIALRGAGEQSANFEQNLRFQDFNQRQDRNLQGQLAGLSLAPSIGNLGFQPLQNLAGIIGGPNNLSKSQSSGQSNSFTQGKGGSSGKGIGFG